MKERRCESFNSKLRDELLNGEILYSLAEVRVVIQGWRQHHNTVRPHSSLAYKPPAPSALSWQPTRAQLVIPVTSDVADKPTMHHVSSRPT
jgi:hypothetical protein